MPPTLNERPPPGLKLLHVLGGHSNAIYEIAWSPDGRRLASCSVDRTIRIWDVEEEAAVQTLEGHDGRVLCLAWSQDGRQLVSGSADRTVRLWNLRRGKPLKIFEDHADKVYSVAWQPRGRKFASASGDGTVRVWDDKGRKLLRTFDLQGQKALCVGWSPKHRDLLAWGSSDGVVRVGDIRKGEVQRLQGHSEQVNSLAWAPNGRLLASGSVDRSIRLWDTSTALNFSVLEGHTKNIESVRFSPDGKLLASKAADDTVRLWWCDARVLVATLPEPMQGNYLGGLAFHPGGKMLATLGEGENVIRIWHLDLDELQSEAAQSDTRHYRNAKVVLVGDTGAGKSGLALRLRGEDFQPTESTHGRQVWILENTEVNLTDGQKETRETLLWDLGGQPGYRLVHQLHLHEIAVALVVFDPGREGDRFGAVHYWDRALRQSRSFGSDGRGPLRKFLVAARVEHGGVFAEESQIRALVKELGFSGFFSTSAKKDLQIEELRAAVRTGIDWDQLPQVSSTQLFHTIRGFLHSQDHERVLVPAGELFKTFCSTFPSLVRARESLRSVFDACIGRLESHGLIRRLSFGKSLLLLRPELLDSYASAIVIAARNDPQGLGILRQEDVLAGSFLRPDGETIPPQQLKLLLRATVEELISYDLALREQTERGTYLVFPSEFCRAWREAPDPPEKAVSFVFEGPTLNIYTTLIIRLANSGSFSASMKQIWRNAVVFDAGTGGCGIYRRQESEGKDELAVFYGRETPPVVRFQFEEFIKQHLLERAVAGTLIVQRFRVCPGCGRAIPGEWVFCSMCGRKVQMGTLAKQFPSALSDMDNGARRSREYETWEMAATAEVEIAAPKPDATVAIVFTDVVGSTSLQSEVGDERMGDIREGHFGQVRALVRKYKGAEIKTLGDGFLATFSTAVSALDFALELYCNTGHEKVNVRVGIHVGITTKIDNDIFGSAVNYAARVCGMAVGAEIWLSDRAHNDIRQFNAARHAGLHWQQNPDRELKGMPGLHTLWSLAEIICEGPGSRLSDKLRAGKFDVFLSYNSLDKSAVKEIATVLAERGILPWFDEWQLRPGVYWQRVLEEQIRNIRTVAVFVGREGLGPWQRVEMEAYLREFVRRGCPIIPVLLPECRSTPDLPLFLEGFVWVDFRDPEKNALEQLIWGITEERPDS